METRQSEELMLRRYLLGRIDGLPEISEAMEERILMDEAFAELAAVIEDEIIEDYLEGVLDPRDHDAIEKHFLRPPERQEKLRLARLVNRSLEGSGRAAETARAGGFPLHRLRTTNQLSEAVPFAMTRPGMRFWAELAVCALLVVSLIYAYNVHRTAETARVQGDRELAAERDRSVQFERQIQNLHGMVQPATVLLNLLQPGVHRGATSLPTLQIGAGSQSIHVEIALQSAPAGLIDVRMENASGKTIWIANGVAAFRSDQSAILILDVPAQGMEPGDHRFVVTQPGGALVYSFSVVKPQ